MYSLYTARKKEEEELRTKNAAAIERAIRGPGHRALTEALSSSHRARVDEWMSTTLAADVPPLQPKPLHIGDLCTQPYKFYRARSRSPRRNGTTGSSSARGTWDTAMFDNDGGLPDHLQMSATKFETEKDRLARYEASSDHAHLTGKEPYSDPLSYSFRSRDTSREVAGPFVYRATRERERVNDAITDRDIGGKAFPWEPPSLYPSYRNEQRSRWKAGHFSARLPPIPIFSQPDRVMEPYQEGGVQAAVMFRAPSPPGGAHTGGLSSSQHFTSHPSRFVSSVPSDRFVSLPSGNPRSPKPPVSEIGRFRNVLGEGLGSSGIYQIGQEEEKTNDGAATARPSRSYWKAAITVAHMPGSQTARRHGDTDTAQQLFRTYRRHLNY
jgi:hypothetical protein